MPRVRHALALLLGTLAQLASAQTAVTLNGSTSTNTVSTTIATGIGTTLRSVSALVFVDASEA